MSEEPAIWHVLVKTRNGNVSILKNLTATLAREVMRSLTPYWQRPDVVLQGTTMFHVHDNDVVQLEAFGPEGETLDVWKDVERPVPKEENPS